MKPVSEQEVDSLFAEVERNMEWYIETDAKGESMITELVRAALVKNLHESITQNLAIELRKEQTIDAVYKRVTVYLHDHTIGLPRSQNPARLHLTEEPDHNKDDTSKPRSDERKPDDKQKEDARARPKAEEGEDLSPVKGCKKGKGKGYGACRHCGEWGHPRRECLQFTGASKGTVNALKGKGKGFKGKGKGYRGGKR